MKLDIPWTEPTIYKVEIKHNAGVADELGGWYYRLFYRNESEWSSEPYKNIFDTLDAIKTHMTEPYYKKLVWVKEKNERPNNTRNQRAKKGNRTQDRTTFGTVSG